MRCNPRRVEIEAGRVVGTGISSGESGQNAISPFFSVWQGFVDRNAELLGVYAEFLKRSASCLVTNSKRFEGPT